MPKSVVPGTESTRFPRLYRTGRPMIEQARNNRLAEILISSEKEARLRQASGRRRTGRQYRRIQSVRHDDRLLFLLQHSGYAPNMGYIIGDYKEKRTLLHSGLHIKYMKSSVRQQYLKRKGNRLVRKCCDLSGKGNRYRKVFDIWWNLY